MKIMKKGTKALIVMLMTFVSIFSVYSDSNADSFYNSKLTLKLEANDKSWTKKDVKIKIKGKEESDKIGIKHLILPNGDKVYPGSKDDDEENDDEISYSFIVEENGEYPFVIEANDGNILEESIIINNIDKNPPELTFEKINIEGKPFIRIVIFDEGSGLKEIVLPNGKKVSIDKKKRKELAEGITYPIDKDGEYKYGNEYNVKLIDKLGNEITKALVIKDVNTEPPIITVLPYETSWTNNDVVVQAIVDKGKLNKSSHTFEKNGSFVFTAEDELGNEAKPVIVRISNIDKIPPSEPRVIKDNINHRLVLAKGIDNQSGIDKTIYSLDEKKWEEFSDYIPLKNFKDDNYKITIKTLDKAGNESISSFSFKIEYGAIESEIQNIILNAKNISDLNGVEELFMKLPDTKKKKELREKLNKKKVEIEELIIKIENAVSLAETMKREPYIANAREAVEKLREGKVKDDFNIRLNALDGKGSGSCINSPEQKEELAESQVKMAEIYKREPYIANARKAVNKLTDASKKAELNARLDAITSGGNIGSGGANSPATIKSVESKVKLAEVMKRDSYIDSAREIVAKLDNSPEKTAFLERLDAIKVK